MLPFEPRPDQCRDVASLLLGGRRDAGHRVAVGPGDRDGVADREDVGMAGHGEIGRDLQAPGAIGRRVQPFRGGRGAHAGGPDDGPRFQLLAAKDHAVDRAFGDGLAEHHLDAELFQRRCA